MQNRRDLTIDWPTLLFLTITPAVAFILTPIHMAVNGVSWSLMALLIIYGGISNLSITAGYHRCLSHQSYTAGTWLKIAYLFFGASAFQGTALKWCTDHRRHHRFVDTEQDPYNINRGFFYAHMGWLFFKDTPETRGVYAPDLAKDYWIDLQHRYYVPIAIVSGFGVPTLIGYMMGAPLGGLIFGGALRIVLTQQSTFLINSYCHYFGKQTYGQANSAKDSLFISFFTHGEGYHNFHHHFQADYRNGVRWYDWDPTKWFIRLASFLGLARGLRRVPSEKILLAEIENQSRSLVDWGASADWVERLKLQVEESQRRWAQRKAEYQQFKATLKRSSSEKIQEMRVRYVRLREEMRLARQEFQRARRQWKVTFRQYEYARVNS